MKTWRIIVLLALCGVALSAVDPNKKLLLVPSCEEGRPHFSVGDYNLTQKILEELLRTKKEFLVAVSTSNCLTCCKYEWNLQELRAAMKSNIFLRDVPFTRLDVTQNLWFTKMVDGLERYPSIIYSYDGKMYVYRYYWETTRIIRFIEQVRSPLVEFESLEEVELFLNERKRDSYNNSINTVHVVGMFYDLEEVEEDLKQFQLAAENSRGRAEIYFGLLKNKKEIKRAQKKYGSAWFEDYSLSTIFIQRIPNRYSIVDLSKTSDIISNILYVKALKLVDEITMSTHKYYASAKKPIIIMLLDTVYDEEGFVNNIKLLEDIAFEFEDVVHVVYSDGLYNERKREVLGIYHSQLPALAFYRVFEEPKLVYPPEWPLTVKGIKSFILDYYRFKPEEFNQRLNTSLLRLQKDKIYDVLTGILELNKTNYDTKVLQRTSDIIVLFFDSKHYDKAFEKSIRHFAYTARRFRELKLKSVTFAIFDLFYHQAPSKEIDTSKETIILFPYKKSPVTFEQDPKTLLLMKFLEENSGVRFHLPENPHVQESDLEDFYYKQVYEENFKEEDYLPRDEL